MFFFLRNEPKVMTLIRTGLIAVFAIVMIVLGTIDVIRINQKPIDLNETHKDWNQLTAGTHVEMDVDILIGQYMTTTDNGAEVSRDYLMPHLNYDSHNDYYDIDRVIGVKINRSSGNFETADRIVDNTVAWWNDRTGNVEYNTVTIHIDGYLQKMNGSQEKYVREAMEAAGFTPHDMASMLVPYYISDNSSSGKILLLCGFIALIAAGGLGFYAIRKQG